MPQSKEFLEHWEELIDAVEKSNVPMHFINRIILNFDDEEENKTVEIKAFRDQGYTEEEIELVISQIVNDAKSQLESMDFFLDVENVAVAVQQETSILLKNIP